jgi:hypothetical protein
MSGAAFASQPRFLLRRLLGGLSSRNIDGKQPLNKPLVALQCYAL